MTMGKDPAVLFYTSDFLGGVTLMDMKERGQYITLLCLQRERGHMTEQEMKKAIGGKLSDELRSKFVVDEDGKLYNVRMETEVQKRNAHCQKQRENVQKRWDKKKSSAASAGMNDGNTVVHTTVLPLGNGSRSRTGYRNDREELSEETVEVKTEEQEDRGYGGKKDDLHDPELARVMSHYLNTIDPTPSSICTQELIDYTEQFGADIVLHAIDRARDKKKSEANWLYIRGILRKYSKANIQTLGDVFRDEQTFDEAMDRKAEQRGGGHTATPTAGAIDDLQALYEMFDREEGS